MIHPLVRFARWFDLYIGAILVRLNVAAIGKQLGHSAMVEALAYFALEYLRQNQVFGHYFIAQVAALVRGRINQPPAILVHQSPPSGPVHHAVRVRVLGHGSPPVGEPRFAVHLQEAAYLHQHRPFFLVAFAAPVMQPRIEARAGLLHRRACWPAGNPPACRQLASRADQGAAIGNPKHLVAGFVRQVALGKQLAGLQQGFADLVGIALDQLNQEGGEGSAVVFLDGVRQALR